MRFVELTEQEENQLDLLFKTSSNSVVRQRSLSLLYSSQRHSIKEVSRLVKLSRRSIERLLNAWDASEDKFSVLSVSGGRGAKVKLAPVKDLLPDLVKAHARNLNPIIDILQREYNIEVCKLTLQNFLKEIGL